MTIGIILEGREGSIISVERGTSVKHAITKLAEHRIGAMPVVDGDEVIGRENITQAVTDGPQQPDNHRQEPGEGVWMNVDSGAASGDLNLQQSQFADNR